MSRISEIFEFMRECPQLENLYSIAATEDIGTKVILPQGSSPAWQYEEDLDVTGSYSCNITPYPSIFEDFQINCFQYYDPKDATAPRYNSNILNYDEVQAVCDWVMAQNEARHLPEITGKDVISIECIPLVPQIRYVNAEEGTIAYFVTIRVRYVNKAKQMYYEN